MMSNKTLSPTMINSPFTNHYSIVTDNNENKPDALILWFDSNINSDKYIEETQNRLQRINVYAIFYTELQLCLNYVQSIDNERIFLVISDSSADQLLPHIVKLLQVDAIFIISTDKTRYEYLTVTHSKIIGIYTSLDFLCASIRKEIDFNDQKSLTFSFFDQNQKPTQHISNESARFLWFQLFKHVILHLSHNRQNYHDNLTEQTLIDQDYRPEEAIRWYIKQSFLSKFMTKALRNQDIDQLRTIGFFIADLSENLACEHQKILASNEHILLLYRGTKLTKKQLKKLRKNEGTLISMNDYLSTTRHSKSAFALAMKPTQRTDVVPVLFEIKCNIRELGQTIIFADLDQYSENPIENEVLFDITTTFRLKSIQRYAQLWLIKMNASNDGQIIANNYLEEKHRETEEQSLCIVFGRLMCILGHYDKAQKYFERLINEQNDKDLAWIEFNLGRTHDLKGESKIAEKYYNQAFNRMTNDYPTRWKETIYILNKLGNILHDQDKNDKALDYYQQALKTQQKSNSSDRINNARILSNIAFILHIQGNYNEALDYYQQALKTLKKDYTSDHIDIARNLNNIGNILYQKSKYDEAADHYRQALKIHENLYPGNRIETAQILSNIGLILNIQGKYNDALDVCQHALKMLEKLYPSGHIDTAGCFNNIGIIFYNLEQYDEALYYHQQAFKIRQKKYPSGHVDIARSLSNIGNILYQQCKYDEALDYYLQTLTMQETFYLPDHVDIALSLNNIGCTLDQQGKYTEAFHYHQNALNIQQKLYTSGHPDMAYSLNNIGNILYQQGKYNEALDYHQRALKMREKFYPSGHVDISDSLNNIGMIYEQMQKLKISHTYFQRALVLYKKILPSGHSNIETVQANIRRATTKK